MPVSTANPDRRQRYSYEPIAAKFSDPEWPVILSFTTHEEAKILLRAIIKDIATLKSTSIFSCFFPSRYKDVIVSIESFDTRKDNGNYTVHSHRLKFSPRACEVGLVKKFFAKYCYDKETRLAAGFLANRASNTQRFSWFSTFFHRKNAVSREDSCKWAWNLVQHGKMSASEKPVFLSSQAIDLSVTSPGKLRTYTLR